MKNLLSVFVVFIFSFFSLLAAEETVWQIALPDSPSATEMTAADELQLHIRLMTGTEFPICAESNLPSACEHVLYVGATRYTKSILETKHPEPFLFDEIFIKAKDSNLVLCGHERRGALYAVYTFLEDVCGCRWFTPEVSRIPSLSTLSFPDDLEISYAPKIHSREMYNPNAQSCIFSARNKGNGNIDAQHGGRISILNGVHSFFRLIPPEKYFEDHPDWFSEIDGKRVGEDTQLCLTNDEMREELTKNVLQELRDNPGTTIVDISQNDRFKFCTCEKCRAADEEEDSHAGTLIRFLNLVAADIEKEFPDVLVETLAYQYTRKPPKLVKPRENLLIRLCSIECDFSQPFTAPSNADFFNDLSGWSRIAPHLFIWDYVTNYDDLIGPHPNWRVLAPNIRTLTDHHMIGLFEEGEGDDFCEMKNWVLMKLMWNPDLDTEELMTEFCDTYYGKEATPYILKYWEILLDAAQGRNVSIGCFYAHAWRWIDIQTLNAATIQMRLAEDAIQREFGIDSPEYLRFRKSRLAIDSVWLRGYGYWKSEAQRLNLPFEGPVDFKTAAKHFSEICEKVKIQGPSLDIVGQEGKAWFNELPQGTFTLYPLPFNSEWTLTSESSINDGNLLLNMEAFRGIGIYSSTEYLPTELVAEFKIQPNDSQTPAFMGLIFGADDKNSYSYIALDRKNVLVGNASPENPASVIFDKPSPDVVQPWEYNQWHQLHIIFHKSYITLYVDNVSVYQWLPYPEPKKTDGKIGFLSEKGSVSVRNLFFAGYRL